MLYYQNTHLSSSAGSDTWGFSLLEKKKSAHEPLQKGLLRDNGHNNKLQVVDPWIYIPQIRRHILFSPEY